MPAISPFDPTTNQITLDLIDHADERIEDLLIACTVELDERGRFIFGDEFDISA